LGAKGGLNEIRAHPFFAAIDFDLVFKKKVNFNLFIDLLA